MRAPLSRPVTLAPVPKQERGPQGEPEPWRPIQEIARLASCSRDHLERAVDDGLVHLDLSRPRPGRRQKRAIRLRLSDVEKYFSGGRR